MRRTGVVAVVLMVASCVGVGARTKRDGAPGASEGQRRTRYFQIATVLKFSVTGTTELRTQMITTDVAVFPDRPGSGKARVISQTPFTTSKGTTYIDVGTRLDYNEVHLDGQALALAMVLETNHITGMVTTTQDGRSFEEPVIAQRNLSQQVRLALGVATVVFDVKNAEMGAPKPLGGGGEGTRKEMGSGGTLTQVEMTAKEL